MTGLDKMKNQIFEQAQALAAEKVSKSEDEAAGLLAKAEKRAEDEAAKIRKKGEADIKIYRDKLASSNDLMKRTAILSAKQDIITEILERAYERVVGMSPGEYFEMLVKMAAKYVRAGKGQICFSGADLERLPRFFMEEAGQAAREKGGSLELCEKGIDIENGFILVYGGVEENCTLKALFDSKRDELSDAIRHFLFQ